MAAPSSTLADRVRRVLADIVCLLRLELWPRDDRISLLADNWLGRQRRHGPQSTAASGTAGDNRYRWNGVSSHGVAVGSGIYFYRLFADGVEFRNNEQRVVFVGRQEN